VVGLSFVDGRLRPVAPGAAGGAALEGGWAWPLLHAGASALVGPRWSVLPAAEQLFVRTFYRAYRAGAPLGGAVRAAREQVRLGFPHRPDWLAYAFFGHPNCRPYPVEPAAGFATFEAVDNPADTPFRAGRAYRFRASYRTEAPVGYSGRLRRPTPLQGAGVEVMVAPLAGGAVPSTYRLEALPGGADCQCVVTLTMPRSAARLPVLVRFQKGEQELKTLLLNYDVVGAHE
jgi:hypothetical protein